MHNTKSHVIFVSSRHGGSSLLKRKKEKKKEKRGREKVRGNERDWKKNKRQKDISLRQKQWLKTTICSFIFLVTLMCLKIKSSVRGWAMGFSTEQRVQGTQDSHTKNDFSLGVQGDKFFFSVNKPMVLLCSLLSGKLPQLFEFFFILRPGQQTKSQCIWWIQKSVLFRVFFKKSKLGQSRNRFQIKQNKKTYLPLIRIELTERKIKSPIIQNEKLLTYLHKY